MTCNFVSTECIPEPRKVMVFLTRNLNTVKYLCYPEEDLAFEVAGLLSDKFRKARRGCQECH